MSVVTKISQNETQSSKSNHGAVVLLLAVDYYTGIVESSRIVQSLSMSSRPSTSDHTTFVEDSSEEPHFFFTRQDLRNIRVRWDCDGLAVRITEYDPSLKVFKDLHDFAYNIDEESKFGEASMPPLRPDTITFVDIQTSGREEHESNALIVGLIDRLIPSCNTDMLYRAMRDRVYTTEPDPYRRGPVWARETVRAISCQGNAKDQCSFRNAIRIPHVVNSPGRAREGVPTLSFACLELRTHYCGATPIGNGPYPVQSPTNIPTISHSDQL